MKIRPELVFLLIISSMIVLGAYFSYKENIRRSNIEYQIKVDSIQLVQDSLLNINFNSNKPSYNDLYE